MQRIELVKVADLADGTMHMAWVEGTQPVLVVNAGGHYHALQGTCSHEYFELDKGFVSTGRRDPSITCALHMSRFDLATGEALDPPAEQPLATYPVVVDGDWVCIDVPDGPLATHE